MGGQRGGQRDVLKHPLGAAGFFVEWVKFGLICGSGRGASDGPLKGASGPR